MRTLAYIINVISGGILIVTVDMSFIEYLLLAAFFVSAYFYGFIIGNKR